VDEVVQIDSVTTHEVVDGVHLVRGNCKSRLKYEIEYNLKRGTTDNSYVIKVN
jgi:flavorubredoxin